MDEELKENKPTLQMIDLTPLAAMLQSDFAPRFMGAWSELSQQEVEHWVAMAREVLLFIGEVYGYRRLPAEKPPVLTGKQVQEWNEAAEKTMEREKWLMMGWNEIEKTAQRDADWKAVGGEG